MVVITKGAGRVSEVSARFTLDAMPGKQMAIDADLNAGLLTPKRRLLAEQRWLRGGFLWLHGWCFEICQRRCNRWHPYFSNQHSWWFDNRIAQHGLAFSDAAQTYILLSIGDGLVAQVPLLLSIATAIIVTRVSSNHIMSDKLANKLVYHGHGILRLA